MIFPHVYKFVGLLKKKLLNFLLKNIFFLQILLDFFIIFFQKMPLFFQVHIMRVARRYFNNVHLEKHKLCDNYGEAAKYRPLGKYSVK